MGLLSNIARSVGAAGEQIGMMKLKQFSEEELLDKKDELDRLREARIAEAQEASKAKWHDMERGEKMADEVAKHTYEDDPNRLDNQYKKAQVTNLGKSGGLLDTQINKAKYDLEQEQSPDSLVNQERQARIDASNANVNQSNAATNKYNEELKSVEQQNILTKKYLAETDPTKREQIFNDITVLNNKDPYSVKESQEKLKIEAIAVEKAQKEHELWSVLADPNSTQAQKDEAIKTRKLISDKNEKDGDIKVIKGTDENGNPVSYLAKNSRNGELSIVNPAEMYQASKDKAAMANPDWVKNSVDAKLKELYGEDGRSTGTFGFGNNAKEYDMTKKVLERDFTNKRNAVLGIDEVDTKEPSGMLGKKSTDNYAPVDTSGIPQDELIDKIRTAGATINKKDKSVYLNPTREYSPQEVKNDNGTYSSTIDDPTPFTEKLRMLENSKNRQVSSANAKGEMQATPETLGDPGYKIRPAQDGSFEEINRVGRGKGNAMLEKYKGHEDMAAAAYNFGETNVDNAIARARKEGGNWIDYLPKETKDYLVRLDRLDNLLNEELSKKQAQPKETIISLDELRGRK